MTTSGTITYNLVTNELIDKAFHILGKASEGEAMTARMYADGLSSLNLLLKSLGTIEHLWLKTEASVALIAGTASYAVTPKPQRVLSTRISSSGSDAGLTELARQEYYNLPDKVTTGTPTAYYYDPQRTAGTILLYPPPSTAIAAAKTLKITYLRRIEDMVSSTNDLDVPQEWLEAIVWNLASALETEYPVNDERLAKKIDDRAAIFLKLLLDWDTGTQDSVFVQVPVIAEAFELIGKRNINAEDYARAKRTLTNLLGTWTAQEHLWTKTEATLALVADQAAYTMTSPRPQRILSVRRRTTSGLSTIDVPMNELSRQEYFDLPNKTSSPSTPISWYYDPQLTSGVLYIWPAPVSAIISTTALQYTYLRVLATFDGTTLDVPAEWTEALSFSLAARLKIKYPMKDKEAARLIDLRADEAFTRVKAWDTEPASIYFQPEYQGMRW